MTPHVLIAVGLLLLGMALEERTRGVRDDQAPAVGLKQVEVGHATTR